MKKPPKGVWKQNYSLPHAMVLRDTTPYDYKAQRDTSRNPMFEFCGGSERHERHHMGDDWMQYLMQNRKPEKISLSQEEMEWAKAEANMINYLMKKKRLVPPPGPHAMPDMIYMQSRHHDPLFSHPCVNTGPGNETFWLVRIISKGNHEKLALLHMNTPDLESAIAFANTTALTMSDTATFCLINYATFVLLSQSNKIELYEA